MIAGDRHRQGGPRPAHRKVPALRPADLADDRARALSLTPVSRETANRLDRFVDVLLDWQQRLNLVSAASEATLWTRHIADSLQLVGLAPQARVWADFGSGAGFPGLVIACVLADAAHAGACVHLVESNTRRAAFLREAARITAVPAIVHCTRTVDFVDNVPERIDVVTARALAPLSDLLAVTYPLLKAGAIGVFPKGQALDGELTEATKCWTVRATLAMSRTDPKSRIVIVSGLEPIVHATAV